MQKSVVWTGHRNNLWNSRNIYDEIKIDFLFLKYRMLFMFGQEQQEINHVLLNRCKCNLHCVDKHSPTLDLNSAMGGGCASKEAVAHEH